MANASLNVSFLIDSIQINAFNREWPLEHHKLHFGARQLKDVSIAQHLRFGLQRHAIQQGFVHTFDQCDHVTVWSTGNGRHCHTWLANGGHDFDERDLSPSCSP